MAARRQGEAAPCCPASAEAFHASGRVYTVHAPGGNGILRFLGVGSRGPIAVSAASMILFVRLALNASMGAGRAVVSTAPASITLAVSPIRAWPFDSVL